MTATSSDPFLGALGLFGTVPEVTYGTTPGGSTIAALTKAFVFQSETLKKQGNILYRDGLRGTRSHVGDDARVGPYRVGGGINLQPTAGDINWFLPYILGGSSGAWALAETLPSFTAGFARGGENFRYTGCNVNKATFSGSAGQMIALALDIISQDEILDTASWPAISADVAAGPYVFTDALTLTINSTAWPIQSFELGINNALIAGRHLNALTIANAPADDRIITFKTVQPWNSVTAALYDQGIPGFTGCSLVLTHGSHVLTFTFGELQAPASPPTAAQRAENMFTQNWNVLKTGSTMELVVTST